MDATIAGRLTRGVADCRFDLRRKSPPDAKNHLSRRTIDYWVIPPENDAEFVACMEEVLETYEKPYRPKHPVICMDEQPVQLIKENRQPIEATEKHPQRVDYEYERNGTASIFMFTEPLSGFRQATARSQRTKADWAREVAALLDTRHAECQIDLPEDARVCGCCGKPLADLG